MAKPQPYLHNPLDRVKFPTSSTCLVPRFLLSVRYCDIIAYTNAMRIKGGSVWISLLQR